MQITKTHGARFELATDRFREGHPIVFDNLSLRITNAMRLPAQSPRAGSPNPSMRTVRKQISRLLRPLSPPVFCRPPPRWPPPSRIGRSAYDLFHDYGGGAIPVAKLVDGAVVWAHGFPRSDHAA